MVPLELTLNKHNKIISIIIPTYNEYKNLPKLLDKLLNINTLYEKEIIIVDDNSSDGTSYLARNYSQIDRRIRLISRLGRSGLSSAIKEGCLCASGDLIVVMDADGQHEPKTIINGLKMFDNENIDIIIGSRFLEESIIQGLSLKRESGSTIANFLARFTLPRKYKDLTDFMTGFIILKRDSCIKFIERIDVNGFKFLYELLSLSKGKLTIKEIPLIFGSREFGRSKLDIAVVWDFLISLIHTFFGRLIPRRAFSFALVGLIGIFVQMITIYFLLWLTNVEFQKVLPIGVIFAATSNYIINNILTFRSNKLSGKEFYFGLLKFLLVASLPIIANVGVANLFYDQLSSNTFIAQLAGIFVVFIWNYAASSKVVWKN